MSISKKINAPKWWTTCRQLIPGGVLALSFLSGFAAESPHPVDAQNSAPQDSGKVWEQQLQAAADAIHAGRDEEAESAIMRALQLADTFPKNDQRRATTYNFAASYASQMGKFERAQMLYKRALVIYEETMGVEHRFTAIALNNLASACRNGGQLELAEQFFKRALNILERTAGPEDAHLATCLVNIGGLYALQKLPEMAEEQYLRAKKILEKNTLEHPDLVGLLDQLAQLYLQAGKLEKAKPLLERNLELLKKLRGPRHPETVQAYLKLGFYFELKKEFSSAETLYNYADQIIEMNLGAEHVARLDAQLRLAAVFQAQEKYDEAEGCFQLMLPLVKKSSGPDAADYGQMQLAYAAMLRLARRLSEAELVEKHGRQILEKAAVTEKTKAQPEAPQK